MARRGKPGASAAVPDEVAAIRAAIKECLNQTDEFGRVVGSAQYGIYCFYDYDNEPIYVGKTRESLRQRISRHLTNQRTDAVAMNVLDPFEVLTVEMYPLWELAETRYSANDREDVLSRAEYTVYQQALSKSFYHAVLNEGDIAACEVVELPTPFRGQIVPDAVYQLRKHPDIRTARRAMTVANLARVISERDVSLGLRRTLLTQTRRLQHLAQLRLDEFGGDETIDEPGEETDDENAAATIEDEAG